jgi:hypothetical protein
VTESASAPPFRLADPLRAYFKRILLATLLGGSILLVAEATSSQKYAASVVVAPAKSGGDSISSSLSKFSGLAGLAGLDLKGGENVTAFQKFTYLIYSPTLAQWQIDRRHILPVVFSKDWDAGRKEWRRPAGVLTGLKTVVKSLLGMQPWSPPDAYRLAREYDRHLSVSKVGTTDMVRLNYQDTSPARAKVLLRAIVADANEILRDDAFRNASRQAKYIRGELATVTVQDYRQTLLGLLAQQEQTLMLTGSRQAFAAELVGSVDLAPQPVTKRPLSLAIIGGLVCFSLAYFVAAVAWQRRLARQSSEIPAS